MQKIAIILMLLLGTTGGVAAGFTVQYLGAQKTPVVADHSDATPEKVMTEDDFEYLKLNNQFLVPLVQGKRVTGLIAVTMSLELSPGYKDVVYAQEPKLRDEFLQVLFDHANMGGFVGQFTKSSNLEALKTALFDVAVKVSGDIVNSVLITDIARQDL